MNLGSICTRELVALDAEAPLKEAARLMKEHHVGSVVLTRAFEGGLAAVGLVTDRDLAIEMLAQDGGNAGQAVGRLVEGQTLRGLAEGASIGAATALMRNAGVRRLLVHDADGHLVGIVSFDDLLRAVAAQLADLATVLPGEIEREAERASAPPRPTLPQRVRVPAVGTAGWGTGGWGTAWPGGGGIPPA